MSEKFGPANPRPPFPAREYAVASGGKGVIRSIIFVVNRPTTQEKSMYRTNLDTVGELEFPLTPGPFPP